jgi:hypothetical protein
MATKEMIVEIKRQGMYKDETSREQTPDNMRGDAVSELKIPGSTGD